VTNTTRIAKRLHRTRKFKWVNTRITEKSLNSYTASGTDTHTLGPCGPFLHSGVLVVPQCAQTLPSLLLSCKHPGGTEFPPEAEGFADAEELGSQERRAGMLPYEWLSCMPINPAHGTTFFSLALAEKVRHGLL
jgi:hypothetical protein